jgi:hypothetical protein|tara:strand:+ start:2264 stop:3241 length:978 start_codon:yes stop_codon:yes gene_type:complete
MALPRVSAIGFIDTLTVSAVGFVDGIYLPPSSGALTGVNATSSAGAVSAVGTVIELSGVNATASDGTVGATGPAVLAPISGVNSTTSAARISSPLVLMTNIKVGSSAVDKLYVGGTRIYKAYSGYDLVWYQSARATQYRGDTSSHTTNSTTQVHPVNAYWRRYLLAFTYTASELANWDIVSGSVISKLRWYVTNPPPSSRSPYPNYAIRMMHIGSGTINTNPTSLGGLSSSNVTDVKAQHNYVTTATGFHEMTLDNNFTYNGTDAIGFIFAWGQIPTNYTADGQGYILSSGQSYFARTDSSGTYLVTGTAGNSGGPRPVINMYST